MSKLKPLNWAGDTIVEVLIVVIVIGTVLASGYSIAVSSLQVVQLTQEKAYALKLAEGQLESLKSVAATDATVFNAGGYCLTGATPAARVDVGGSSPTDEMEDENYAQYPDSCKKDPNGGSCAGLCYHIGIKKVGTNNFTTSVRWDGPKGTRQQIILSYRLYQ